MRLKMLSHCEMHDATSLQYGEFCQSTLLASSGQRLPMIFLNDQASSD